MSNHGSIISDDKTGKSQTRRKALSVTFLVLFTALIAYDNMALDGTIPLIQKHFSVSDSSTAVIKTSSSIASTGILTLMWLYGDRFNRKLLLLSSMIGWIFANALSLFSGANQYWLFVGTRTFSSMATSIFETLRPAILVDFYRDKSLSRAFMVVSLADLFGSPISLSVTSWFVTSGFPWQSGLLPATLISLFLVPVLAFVLPKGFGKTSKPKHANVFKAAASILKIKSYTLIIISISCAMFNLKAVGFWYPSFLLSAWNFVPEVFLGLSYPTVSTIVSVADLASTFIGLPVIMWIAESWQFGSGLFKNRQGYPRAFPIIVFLCSVISLFTALIGIFSTDKNAIVFFVSQFVNGIFSAAMIAMTNQMKMSVLARHQRASGAALMQLTASILTFPAAQLFGMISDSFRGESQSLDDRYFSYRNAFLVLWIFKAVTTVLIIALIYFYPGDYEKAQDCGGEKITDETETLLTRDNRSESMFEKALRSRRATVDSIY